MVIFKGLAIAGVLDLSFPVGKALADRSTVHAFSLRPHEKPVRYCHFLTLIYGMDKGKGSLAVKQKALSWLCVLPVLGCRKLMKFVVLSWVFGVGLL
jgi:hypothetical protein